MQANHHVIKMPTETCQLLATAHILPDVPYYHKMSPKERLELDLLPYTHTHNNHICAVWVRQSIHNYHWLLQLGQALVEEFEYRFNKPHEAKNVLNWLKDNEHLAISSRRPPTKHVLAMPEEYYNENPITAYRLYYNEDKQGWWHKSKLKDGRIKAKWFPSTWTKRDVPHWFVRKPAPIKPSYHADIVTYA